MQDHLGLDNEIFGDGPAVPILEAEHADREFHPVGQADALQGPQAEPRLFALAGRQLPERLDADLALVHYAGVTGDEGTHGADRMRGESRSQDRQQAQEGSKVES
mgnify:CR=1 FL=1